VTLPVRFRWAYLSLGLVLADRLSKLAVERFTEEGFSRTLIPGLLNFVHVRNRGVAFSLLADADSSLLRPALIVFGLTASALLGWVLATGRAGSARAEFGLALVLGGAIGNLLDRILRGSVVDFVDFHIRQYHWPAFNLADSAITIGAILVIWDLLFSGHKQQA
jgi:signal peptidase II